MLRAIEQAGSDAGPEPAGAVDPHPAGRHLGHPFDELVERYVDRAGDRAARPFVVAPHVEDLRPRLGGDAFEVGDRVGPQRNALGQGLQVTGGDSGQVVDPDPDQLPLRGRDLLGESGAPHGTTQPT